MGEEQNGYFEYRPTLGRRFWQIFFPPAAPLDVPEEMPGYVPGSMSINCGVRLDWRDRLRLLISGKIRIEIRVKTNVEVSNLKSFMRFWAAPPGKYE